MNTRQIECFIMAATLGNLTQVAETLFLSVSTVSYQIKNLETELGFPLFTRNNKNLELTEAGRYYLEQIQKLKTAHESIVSRARTIQEESPRLIVGITRDLAVQYYDKLRSTFQNQCKDVDLQLYPVRYQDGVNPLLFGTVDLMFTYQCRLHNTENIESIPLRPTDFYCMISDGNHLAEKDSLCIQDLSSTKVFCEEENLPWIREIIQAEKSRIPIEIQHEMMIPLMVKTNQGISIDTCALHLSSESGLLYRPLHSKRQIHRVLAWNQGHERPGMETFRKITQTLLQ